MCEFGARFCTASLPSDTVRGTKGNSNINGEWHFPCIVHNEYICTWTKLLEQDDMHAWCWRKAHLCLVHWRHCSKIVHPFVNIAPVLVPRLLSVWVISWVSISHARVAWEKLEYVHQIEKKNKSFQGSSCSFVLNPPYCPPFPAFFDLLCSALYK